MSWTPRENAFGRGPNGVPGPVACVLALGLLAPALAATGQETYRLAEDDTWVQSASVDPGTPEGQLSAARRLLAAGEHERADHLATQWIDRNPSHPRLPDAYLIRGDSLRLRRHYYDALFDYEHIVRLFPGSELFVAALERELDIAEKFATGTRRRLWGMRIADASDIAEELLIRIQERLPGSVLAERAALVLADFYFRRRDMELAAQMYAIFVENFPHSAHVDQARKRLIYAHLASFKGPEFDAAGLYEARARLLELKRLEPTAAQQLGVDSLLTRIDESDARKLLETARWYVKTGDVIAAELTIRRLVRTYPRSVAAEDAIRLVSGLVERLPGSVLAEAPDYAKLREAILGTPAPPSPTPRAPAAGAEPPPASRPAAPPVEESAAPDQNPAQIPAGAGGGASEGPS
jgi:outer membrane protein assembly factor BamD (BamD/ComL family)